MARKARNGVVFYGPLFEGDPAKRVGQNIDRLVHDLTSQAVQTVRAEFTPGHGSELAETIAEKHPTKASRTYLGVVYSRMSEENRARSWVTWAERGRRRDRSGATVQSSTFRGFRMWARVRRAARARIKDEMVRLRVLKGVA